MRKLICNNFLKKLHTTQAICICGVEKIALCLRSVRAFPSSDRKALASPPNAVSPLRYVQQQKMKKPTLLLDFKTEIKTKYLKK